MEILLKDLFENFDLSVRAYNVCDRVGLKTIGDAKKHHLKYGNFVNILNCGSKTNKEIIECIEKFSALESLPQPIVIPAVTIPINHKVSDKAIAALVTDELNKISVRARNGLLSYFGKKIPTKEQIKEHFIDQKFDSQKIKNIGKKSIPEIECFITAVIDIFNKSAYAAISEQEIVFSTFYDLVGFNVEGEFWLNKYHKKQIPIILFAANHIADVFELKEVDAYIFRNHFNLLEKNYTLEEIAEMYGVGPERIRQRRYNFSPMVLSKASKLIPLIEHSAYNVLFSERNMISIPDDISVDSILKEINQVGNAFSALILTSLSNQKFYSLNSFDKLKKPQIVHYYNKYNSFKNFQRSFLIDHAAISKDDLLRICSEILNALSIRQESNSVLDINKILGHEISPAGSNVIASIVKSHFGIQLHDSTIPISRNSVKLVYEYVFDALLKIGKPAHLSEIRELILSEHPDFDSSEEAMRSSINNRKNVFIHFGRASTYGLKIWEKKNGFIKGGTIRNIVIEFLKKQNTPCHISTITEQVRKYRKTDERSVLTNLKFTKKKIFFFERGGYVGLVQKNDGRAIKRTNETSKEMSLDEILTGIFSTT